MTLRHTVYGMLWACHVTFVVGLMAVAFIALTPWIVILSFFGSLISGILGTKALLDFSPESKASRNLNDLYALEKEKRAAFLRAEELRRLAAEADLPWWDGEKIVWPEVKWPEEEKKNISIDAFGSKNVKTITEVYGDSPVTVGWSGGIPVTIPKGRCGHYPECDSYTIQRWGNPAYDIRYFNCGKKAITTKVEASWSKMDDGEFC